MTGVRKYGKTPGIPLRNIKNFTLAALTGWMTEHREQPFRARQVFQWLYQRRIRTFEGMTDLSAALRSKLGDHFTLGGLERAAERVSGDGSRKFVFRLGDGNLIESVLMPMPNGRHRTLCVSTQV